MQHSAAVQAVLDEHVRLGALREVSSPPTVVSPLIAVTQPDKVRPCLDLSRLVNESVRPVSVRYQRLDQIARLADAFGDDVHAAVFDIGSAFLSFPLRAGLSQYFGVRWRGRFYEYDTLTFGLSFSPAACALFLGAVQLEMWRRGMPSSTYADDFTLPGAGGPRTDAQLAASTALCNSLGLPTPERKIQRASRAAKSLGARLDCAARTVELLPERRVVLAEALIQAADAPQLERREVRRLCGRLAHASATALPWARAFSNELYGLTHGPRSQRLQLPTEARDDLRVWASLVQSWRGARPWRVPPPSRFLISDGSDGGGAFGWRDGSVVYGFTWPEAVRPAVADCTPLGEFLAVLLGLACLPTERGAHVHSLCDASAVVGAINACRGRRALAAPARWCAQFIHANNAHLSASHVSGVSNVWADVASRPELHQFSQAAANQAVAEQLRALGRPPEPPRRFVFLAPALVRRACSLFLSRSPSGQFPRWPLT